ncbi:AmmeMemoRadiSam system protein A [Thermophilibacter mediterraneus]|uniref:AmmeMemoRadiSam system protein A n=1 Tax=Thermophilibacter mediterraneus TaxID=1871031 RepID=UPI002354957E|nr:AmmeMemoRadiSam system protein A [Thermophilibacter mediterraneus]
MPVVIAVAVPHPPLIVPGVGHGREREVQATVDAYREVARRIAALEPETVVVSSPHTAMYLDYLHIAPGSGARGTFAQFGDAADGSRVAYDEELVAELERLAREEGLPAGTRGERERDLDWGVLVPLHFLQEAYAELREAGREPAPYRVVRMGISGLSPLEHYRMGQLVQRAAERLERRVAYVASGDLSHKLSPDGPYGYSPDGPVFDELACEALGSGDLLPLLTADPGLCERAAECGLRSFQIMAGALDRTPVTAELLSHEGPFGVGYGVAVLSPTGPAGSAPERALDETYERWHADDMARRRRDEDPLVALARASLEHRVRGGGRMARLPGDLPGELLSRRAGAFVSITKNGQLRGCIGTIAPTRANLAEEIVENAISTGCHDPRFSPVREDELPELVYDVDVLGEPEPVDGPEQLDCRRYGVIVSASRGRRGLLLPDLDGVDTVDEQLRIAARKGGIDLDEPGVRLERFVVERHR